MAFKACSRIFFCAALAFSLKSRAANPSKTARMEYRSSIRESQFANDGPLFGNGDQPFRFHLAKSFANHVRRHPSWR